MGDDARYLLVVYVAEQRDAEPVSPGAIADAVGRSPAATTEMLQRLDDRGLVAHEPYEGATLTAEGRETATELYDTYATLSRFFETVLGLDDYEEEAMELAGTVSPVVAERLASTLPLDADAAASEEHLLASDS
ncbi:metal-dependent transcriptional regulator [Halorubrum laminariae]|uniref:Metal-dependent transcriptional regulator n=1 Tax=Halorubrum laminariae TaxID=1433523 RepID=A0ABD6BZG9_9EURY|nr:metal-dependent transcriptional regulator [Halorubrum laminariae]